MLLSSWSPQELKIQLDIINFLANSDRLTIHPQKTCINIYGMSHTEMDHLQTAKMWDVNGVPVPVGHEFTHLGINYNFTSYLATVTSTVDTRLKTGRNTTYALMGAGLHGTNGLSPTVSLHIYTIYVQPRVLYGLDAININITNMRRLETAHRGLIRSLQGLPKRTANAAVYILSGALPIEALIDRKRLTMVPSLANNPTLSNIIYRQIAVKDHTSSSWVIKTQSILRKYGLPHMTEVMESESTKEAWKKGVDKAIHGHWKKEIETEAYSKSSTCFLNRT
jgi:hypothetical protein